MNTAQGRFKEQSAHLPLTHSLLLGNPSFGTGKTGRVIPEIPENTQNTQLSTWLKWQTGHNTLDTRDTREHAALEAREMVRERQGVEVG